MQYYEGRYILRCFLFLCWIIHSCEQVLGLFNVKYLCKHVGEHWQTVFVQLMFLDWGFRCQVLLAMGCLSFEGSTLCNLYVLIGVRKRKHSFAFSIIFWYWTKTKVAEIPLHYSDVIMDVIASKNTSASIVYSTVCLGADQRKDQSSASKAFVGEFTGDGWIPRTKGQ